MARVCYTTFFLLIILCVGYTNAQIVTDDVTDQLTWSEWTDGLLVEQHPISDVTAEIIHLDRVLSTFENGWGTSNPGYYFQITEISAVNATDQTDDVYCSFYRSE